MTMVATRPELMLFVSTNVTDIVCSSDLVLARNCWKMLSLSFSVLWLVLFE